MNPRCIDPEQGFIYSANDWPDDLLKHSADNNHKPLMYPGYYKPQYRADRIRALLAPKNEWTLEKMKALINDSKSDVDESIWNAWQPILARASPELVAPTLFNRILYHSMRLAIEDEMGPELFRLFLTTHQFQRSVKVLQENAQSLWWDNVNTPSKETQADILAAAFDKAYSELKSTFGDQPESWTWENSAYLELKHPLGEVAALRPIFNISKREVWGGNETIHQSGFYLDSTSYAKVFFGSQMRTMVDFSDVENGLNITPSGQSGHLLSPHYDDQAELYAQRKFREQTLTTRDNWRKLILTPASH
jgi:penicillin amidase